MSLARLHRQVVANFAGMPHNLCVLSWADGKGGDGGKVDYGGYKRLRGRRALSQKPRLELSRDNGIGTGMCPYNSR